MAQNRTRRLRKKLYTGEFTVLGFEFSCRLEMQQESEFDQLIDDFMAFLEKRDLIMGGGADLTSFDGFVVPEGRYNSATEDDRTAVEQWLTERAKCSEIKVGTLVDANQAL
ncbi:DUF469 family protein [Vibrio sinensis]|uniref:DUF469 family protein n=1 Tax=Vibrio sinensis TaxID=2302434 RepID=A0A3A6Q6W7_9VIBR|nr:50S ribosome-binding protein YggL [Vibrio sinensis]RJX64843.1 DUF469 family protein [Vibrio sinensis]